jgi:hypothetical protein
MDFFYAATTIMIGDGRISSFWHSPWRREKAQGHRTFHISISTQKNFAVHKAYLHEFLIAKLNRSISISLNQISEFVDLWMRVNEVHLVNFRRFILIGLCANFRTHGRGFPFAMGGGGLKRLDLY